MVSVAVLTSSRVFCHGQWRASSRRMAEDSPLYTYFFGVGAPPSLGQQLQRRLSEIDADHEQRNGRRLVGAWEPASNYHMTVLYLGSPTYLPAWKVARAAEVLESYEPFELKLTGDFDLFGRARNIAVALVEDGGMLTRIQHGLLERFAESADEEPEEEVDAREVGKLADILKKRRGVKPHITMQRNTVRGWPKKEYKVTDCEAWAVDAVHLYRGSSVVENGRKRRVYEVAESIPLRGESAKPPTGVTIG